MSWQPGAPVLRQVVLDTWPDGPYPQMLHLDLTVPTAAELDAAHKLAPVSSSTAPRTTRSH